MSPEGVPSFEIPAEMRHMAEQSVEQARKALHGFIAAAQQAVSTLEGHAAVVQAGAKDVGKKALSFGERNVANSFDFMHKLVGAKDVQEVMRLHSEFIRTQMEAFRAGQGAWRDRGQGSGGYDSERLLNPFRLVP